MNSGGNDEPIPENPFFVVGHWMPRIGSWHRCHHHSRSRDPAPGGVLLSLKKRLRRVEQCLCDLIEDVKQIRELLNLPAVKRPEKEDPRGLALLFDGKETTYRHTCKCGAPPRVNREDHTTCIRCHKAMTSTKVKPRKMRA